MTELSHAIARARLLTKNWPDHSTIIDPETGLTVADVLALLDAFENASLPYAIQPLPDDGNEVAGAHPS